MGCYQYQDLITLVPAETGVVVCDAQGNAAFQIPGAVDGKLAAPEGWPGQAPLAQDVWPSELCHATTFVRFRKFGNTIKLIPDFSRLGALAEVLAKPDSLTTRLAMARAGIVKPPDVNAFYERARELYLLTEQGALSYPPCGLVKAFTRLESAYQNYQTAETAEKQRAEDEFVGSASGVQKWLTGELQYTGARGDMRGRLCIPADPNQARGYASEFSNQWRQGRLRVAVLMDKLPIKDLKLNPLLFYSANAEYHSLTGKLGLQKTTWDVARLRPLLLPYVLHDQTTVHFCGLLPLWAQAQGEPVVLNRGRVDCALDGFVKHGIWSWVTPSVSVFSEAFEISTLELVEARVLTLK